MKNLRDRLVEGQLQDDDIRIIEEWGQNQERDRALCSRYTHYLSDVVVQINALWPKIESSDDNKSKFSKLIAFYKKLVGSDCIDFVDAAYAPCQKRQM